MRSAVSGAATLTRESENLDALDAAAAADGGVDERAVVIHVSTIGWNTSIRETSTNGGVAVHRRVVEGRATVDVGAFHLDAL
jgi:hypothetical protein